MFVYMTHADTNLDNNNNFPLKNLNKFEIFKAKLAPSVYSIVNAVSNKKIKDARLNDK